MITAYAQREGVWNLTEVSTGPPPTVRILNCVEIAMQGLRMMLKDIPSLNSA